jgi:hypothetical protein
MTEINLDKLKTVTGGFAWGQWGLNIAANAIGGFRQGGLLGAGKAALATTEAGLRTAANGG